MNRTPYPPAARVQWNPTGDTWKLATVNWDGGVQFMMIRLAENHQVIMVDSSHVRPAPGLGALETTTHTNEGGRA
ncbi:hypothetical protein [Saccharopolyspora griseoalba]|uniref:hypothetical protein n=1 Tax=Saccharopolyspora griseoalba TaxID=1431848 RepID=UPI0036D35471